MASHIPLALSLLSTVASHYPGLNSVQKPLPNPPAAVVPPPGLPVPSTSSAPVTIPIAPSSHPPGGTPGTAALSTSASNLCDICHVRPKHFDGTKTHPYCSKSCASKAMTHGTSTHTSGNSSTSSGSCDLCHNRPKYFDGIRTHPFCSKACAKNSNAPQRKPSVATIGINATCQAPGCQKPPHTNPNGTFGDYCSMAHKALGATICIMCRQAPMQTNSHFCNKSCSDDAEKKGPMILEVPSGHVTFTSVADQFKVSWRHSGKVCPPVRRVYKILAPQTSLHGYNAYRAAVEARGQFISQGRSPGNENRRWHGTRRECNLGDGGHTQFCSSTTCSLCCIVRTSFDLSLFGKKTGWGRFGKGIYTSSTSSKSNDYSHNDCTSPLKAMLLNKVVVGKGCKMTQDNVSLTEPPAGYDSVLAEKGGRLNYDELVVYTNDAIRPSFLVMYEP